MLDGTHDVVIVGAGPNGLTAAAYLAGTGARVLVLERRFERGGTFATDDYSTPFLYNLGQFALPLGPGLRPVRELDLEAHAVRFVEPELVFAAALAPGDAPLLVGRGGSGLGAGVEELLAGASDAVEPLLWEAPEDEAAILDRLGTGHPAAVLAGLTPAALAGAPPDPRAGVILRYACALAGFLDPREPLGLVGAYAVARQFWPSLVVGGTKNLANALFRVAAGAGARCAVSTEVTRAEPQADGFRLRLADRRDVRAVTVVSTLDPQTTFGRLLPPEAVPGEVREAADAWRGEDTGCFTAHFGIRGDGPDAAGGVDGEPLVRIVGFDGVPALERHLEAARRGELPPHPAGHLTHVTAHDVQQASPGPYGPLHTLRFGTFAPYRHPHGTWDRERRAYRGACWELILAHTSGLDTARLLFAFCDSPHDLERRFAGTRRGSLRQGALVPAQTLRNRPHPRCSTGRTPVPGLYLGGGGVHPGIPGLLAAGRNVARLVAEDRA